MNENLIILTMPKAENTVAYHANNKNVHNIITFYYMKDNTCSISSRRKREENDQENACQVLK